MLIILVLAALALCAIAASIAALRNDGYRRIPTDWARLP